MADVFISYSSQDRGRVAELAHALEQSGVSLWWDRRLVPGDGYEGAIEAELTSAKAVVVIWTQAAAASQWVRSEADYARNKGNLIPVRFEACSIPRPFDRLHTADMSRWKGDKGNQGFPELIEAIQSRVEGRAARPIRWRRRITLAAVGSVTLATIGLVSGLTGIADAVVRYTNGDQYAASAAQRLLPENSSPETQEGFQQVLKQLSMSLDLRTQKALTKLEAGSRTEAVQALKAIAEDQSNALRQQMDDAGTLWRQLGLLLFNDDPPEAIRALVQARRFKPDDLGVLTPLAALYYRTGRASDAESIYAEIDLDRLSPNDQGLALQVLGQGMLDRGLHQSAQTNFNAALAKAEAIGNDLLISDLLIDLGRVSLEKMEVEDALASFHEAESFAEAIPYPRSALYARLNQIEALIAAGRPAEAATLLAGAAGQAREQTDNVASLMLDLSTARIALRQGETGRAARLAETSLTTARNAQLRDPELQAELLLAESDILSARWASAQSRASGAEASWRALRNESSAVIASVYVEAARAGDMNMRSEACGRLDAILASAPTPYAKAETTRVRALSPCGLKEASNGNE